MPSKEPDSTSGTDARTVAQPALHAEGDDRERGRAETRPRRVSRPLVLVACGAALLALGGASVLAGSSDISAQTALAALASLDPNDSQQLVVRDIRAPRALASALVGAAFAVAGALMQATTRNPMADSGLLGINAGAAFTLSFLFSFAPGAGFAVTAGVSFAGAALAALLVGSVAFSGSSRAMPMRTVLAGAAVGALLTAIGQGVSLYFDTAQDLMFWTVGSVASVSWDDLAVLAPIVLVAVGAACALGRRLSLLSLGEEVAQSLGLDTRRVMAAALGVALLLAGVSVSVVGAVGFVGLVVPHLARRLVGVDYRWVVPASALLGACLLVAADIGARLVSPPFDTPIGVLTALIGIPFFLYVARNQPRGM